MFGLNSKDSTRHGSTSRFSEFSFTKPSKIWFATREVLASPIKEGCKLWIRFCEQKLKLPPVLFEREFSEQDKMKKINKKGKSLTVASFNFRFKTLNFFKYPTQNKVLMV